jgi:hypothetical protein
MTPKRIIEEALSLPAEERALLPDSLLRSLKKAWPIFEDDIPRCLTMRFPYGVIYSEERDAIFILAVMHLHQEPDYWKEPV